MVLENALVIINQLVNIGGLLKPEQFQDNTEGTLKNCSQFFSARIDFVWPRKPSRIEVLYLKFTSSKSMTSIIRLAPPSAMQKNI